MSAIDQMVVATASLTVVRELGGAVEQAGWLVSAYLLTSTISMAVTDKLADTYGRKPALLLALALFVAGSTLENPAARGDVAAGPGAAVEEFLRYDPPVRLGTFRCARAGIDIDGVTIHAGDAVIVDLVAAGRDPDQLSNPGDLDVSRKITGQLAFGHGIHHCLGAPLARAEGRIAIGTLLRRLPGLPPGRHATPAKQRHHERLATLEVTW